MNEKLLCWINKEKDKLLKKGIVTDEIVIIGDDSDEPCVRVDQSTKECLGRICIWKNGMIDLEVLDIKTEKQLMIAHYEEQIEIQCFIELYMKVMLKN